MQLLNLFVWRFFSIKLINRVKVVRTQRLTALNLCTLRFLRVFPFAFLFLYWLFYFRSTQFWGFFLPKFSIWFISFWLYLQFLRDFLNIVKVLNNSWIFDKFHRLLLPSLLDLIILLLKIRLFRISSSQFLRGRIHCLFNN